MNRLSTVGKGVGETAIGSLDGRQFRIPKTIHVLSVGPVDFGSMVNVRPPLSAKPLRSGSSPVMLCVPASVFSRVFCTRL